MRSPGKFPPTSAAQRQRKCRAIKRGTWRTIPDAAEPHTPGLPIPTDPNLLPPPPQKQTPALPAPVKSQPRLPAPPPPTTIQKSLSTNASLLALANGSVQGMADELHLSLPPAVAARLRSLLDRHESGKTLTAAERAEAQGLLDIAEFFVVERLRNRLAA
jgi:hypothetical protein